ncbi:MAG TPA: tyrosine protein phosphatase [Micromonosporaceae bacterium]|nr:tyrosine protein phosphatase [Micromonosporaceae bacterium]
MAALRQAGVDLLVCLLTDAERAELDLLDEAAAATRAGLEFSSLPIPDFGVPDHVEADALVSSIVERLGRGQHVAVHCWGGVGRSSLVTATVMVRLGTGPERAWEIISAARGVRVPEAEAQRRWLDHHVAQSG